MIERSGDLFTPGPETFAICIPTNGEVTKGSAVMGAGLALAAKRCVPGIERLLGRKLIEEGNHVFFLTSAGLPFNLVSFPTKDRWREPSSLALIERSARELRILVEAKLPPASSLSVALPRVGCGLGGLRWSVVAPILLRELPGSRYVILHKE